MLLTGALGRDNNVYRRLLLDECDTRALLPVEPALEPKLELLCNDVLFAPNRCACCGAPRYCCRLTFSLSFSRDRIGCSSSSSSSISVFADGGSIVIRFWLAPSSSCSAGPTRSAFASSAFTPASVCSSLAFAANHWACKSSFALCSSKPKHSTTPSSVRTPCYCQCSTFTSTHRSQSVSSSCFPKKKMHR